MDSEIISLPSACADDGKNKTEKGTLYLVTTPIGNLADLSPRACKVLRECDFVAAEDTRNTLKLLTLFGIKKELVSYHEHNKAQRGPELCDRIADGDCCALVTDAGMPAISDPGEDIVRLCAERGIPVTAVPGPCAAVTALSLSALATGRFAFEGFLPVPKKERNERLEAVRQERRTLILYEAPHRLEQTLGDLARTVSPLRRLSLCRELTKRNEEISRTTLGEALKACRTQPPRGEYVLILEGRDEFGRRLPDETEELPAAAPNTAALSATEAVAYYAERGKDRKEAMKAAALDRGITKSAFYDLWLKEKENR